ncbi:MAG: hypothetical protein V3T05_00210 [Myxococcota bacterium]
MTNFRGSDRRRHSVYITRNSEYHLRDRLCVGVRGTDGEWLEDHAAVGSELVATMQPNGAIVLADVGRPRVGGRLCFASDLMTSSVLSVTRPSVTAVLHYPEVSVT